MKQSVKTTIEIYEDLLYLAKMKAVHEKRSLKEIVNESLNESLKGNIKHSKIAPTAKIGGHKLGGVKGTLSRTEIYEDF